MAAKKKRLLVVTRHSPFPQTDGAGAYLFDILSYLAKRGWEIEVAWLFADGAVTRRGWWVVPKPFTETARLRVIGNYAVASMLIFPAIPWLPFKAKTFHFIKSGFQKTGLWALLRRKPSSPTLAPSSGAAGTLTSEAWSAAPSENETAFFLSRLRRFRPQAVLVNYCWLTPLLDEVKGVHTSVLTNDVVSQRLSPTPGRRPDPGLPEGEAELLSKAQSILAISEDDAAVFRSFVPGHNILLTPKAASARAQSTEAVEGRCLFVGGINEFNREGLTWFLAEVWPLVLAAAPDAVLHVCGPICGLISAVPAGVILRGRIENLATEYGPAAVVVVPLLRGTGVKIKLVEACSYGKACVTTPVGLQGLSFFRDAVRVAPDAQSFAASVLELLRDPGLRRQLHERTLSAIKDHLSPEHCYQPLADELSGTDSTACRLKASCPA